MSTEPILLPIKNPSLPNIDQKLENIEVKDSDTFKIPVPPPSIIQPEIIRPEVVRLLPQTSSSTTVISVFSTNAIEKMSEKTTEEEVANDKASVNGEEHIIRINSESSLDSSTTIKV